jgi:hypothetical protein
VNVDPYFVNLLKFLTECCNMSVVMFVTFDMPKYPKIQLSKPFFPSTTSVVTLQYGLMEAFPSLFYVQPVNVFPLI